MPAQTRSIIAHHLILTLYGHWISNDLRGSGSNKIRKEELEILGPILPGRQYPQPPKQLVKEFYRKANPLLDHEVVWIDSAKRQAIAGAIRETIKRCGYTCWACAIMWNHLHLVIRRHRDDALTMWDEFAQESRAALQRFDDIGAAHPVWSDRPYKVFLYTPDDVRGRIKYVEDNPEKERLERQFYEFVQSHNGWPFHKMRS